MSLWMPPRVSAELEEERRMYEAAILLMTECDPCSEALSKKVAEIDPALAVVRAKPTVSTSVPLRPGYYHLVRYNPGAPMSVTVIEGPDGEYVEPGSQMLDLIRSQDMWNPEVRRRHEREQEDRKAQEAKDLAREREEITEEIVDRYKAATQASVSMNRDVAWSQNAAGRRGARR